MNEISFWQIYNKKGGSFSKEAVPLKWTHQTLMIAIAATFLKKKQKLNTFLDVGTFVDWDFIEKQVL